MRKTEGSIKNGFYWVKNRPTEDSPNPEWEIAYYTGDKWLLIDWEGEETTDYWEEVGEMVTGPYAPIREL